MESNNFISPDQFSSAGNWLTRLLLPIKRFTTTNLFLILAVITAVFVLFFVPQVKHVWAPQRINSPLGAMYVCLLLALAFIYATTMLRFVLPKYNFGPLFKPAGFINGWLRYIARYLYQLGGNVAWNICAALLVTIGAVSLLFADITQHQPYLMFGSFVQTAGLWLVAAGAWFFVGTRLTGDSVFDSSVINRSTLVNQNITGVDDRGEGVISAWLATGETLAWIGFLGTMVEIFWLTASFDLPGASYRLYTVSSLIHFCVFIVVLAALIDYIQNVSPLPARTITVVAGTMMLATTSSNLVKDPLTLRQALFAANSAEEIQQAIASSHGAQPAQQTPGEQTQILQAATNSQEPALQIAAMHAADSEWLTAFEARIDNIPPGPIVFMALSGGGSRAALFSAHVLQLLAQEKLPAIPEAGDPERRATGQSTWADHIALISSVSGGSLAAARYVYNDDHDISERVSTPRYTIGNELIEEAILALREIKANAQANNAVTEKIHNDIDRLIEELQAKNTEQSDLTDLKDSAIYSRFSDDMSMDFMASVLRGLTAPRTSRGEGLYHFWEQQFGWDGISQRSGHHSPEKPLIFFNTTDADSGRRVIVGQPALPHGLIARHADVAIDSIESTRARHYLPKSLSDLVWTQTDFSLSRAVRLSSNFPFGFSTSVFSEQSTPAVRLQTEFNKTQEPEAPVDSHSLRLLDGGIVDNTGIDSLHALIASLAHQARQDPLGDYAALLHKVRSRGVVIVEVDSGAKPAMNTRPGILGSITAPLETLGNANFVNAMQSTDRLLVELANNLELQPQSRVANALREDNTANATRVYTGPLGTSLTSAQLAAALPAVIPASHRLDMPDSVPHFRFESSQIDDDKSAVMTAFALGPGDKGTVMSLYLLEALKWREQYPDILDDYRFAIAEASSKQHQMRHNEDLRGDLSRDLLAVARQEIQHIEARMDYLVNNAEPTDLSRMEQAQRLVTRALVPLMLVREIAPDSEINAKNQTYTSLRNIVDNILRSPYFAALARQLAQSQSDTDTDTDTGLAADSGQSVQQSEAMQEQQTQSDQIVQMEPRAQQKQQQSSARRDAPAQTPYAPGDQILNELQQAQQTLERSYGTDSRSLQSSDRFQGQQSTRKLQRQQADVQRTEYFDNIKSDD